MSIQKSRNGKQWTEKEDEFLEQNLQLLTLEQLAKLFKRSEGSITSRAYFLGLRFTKLRFTKLKDEDEEHNDKIRKIYDEAIKKEGKVKYGIDLSKYRYKKGNEYEVTIVDELSGYKQDEYFTGELIYQTYRHITLESGCRRESFLKVNFATGELKIKEVV